MINLQAVGISDKKTDIIVYCQSGRRASQTYITLKNLGFNKVRLYDGSMAEYGHDRKVKLTRGANPL